MGQDSWTAKGLSPFLSERARSRAPQILSFAAVPGAAMLVSPTGTVALFSGAAEVDTDRIARVAQQRCGSSYATSFSWNNICVHAAPVSMGWVLCILSTTGVHPTQVVERLRRASAVFALALADGDIPAGGSDGGPAGGAPAEAFLDAYATPSRKN